MGFSGTCPAMATCPFLLKTPPGSLRLPRMLTSGSPPPRRPPQPPRMPPCFDNLWMLLATLLQCHSTPPASSSQRTATELKLNCWRLASLSSNLSSCSRWPRVTLQENFPSLSLSSTFSIGFIRWQHSAISFWVKTNPGRLEFWSSVLARSGGDG